VQADPDIESIRALLAGRPDPLPEVRALQGVLSLWGYNFENPVGVLRENDAIVRQRARDAFLEAAKRVETLAAAYKAEHVPPVSREHPFPDPKDALVLDRAQKTASRLRGYVGEIAAMEMPAKDHISRRVRDEETLLVSLVSLDIRLVVAARAIAESAAGLASDDLADPQRIATLTSACDAFSELMRERRSLL
jgi:hypothetical protein